MNFKIDKRSLKWDSKNIPVVVVDEVVVVAASEPPVPMVMELDDVDEVASANMQINILLVIHEFINK